MQKIMKLPYLASIFLLVYMPFHIFFSQWLSTYTGHLEVWKIGKDVLLFAAILLASLLVYLNNGFKNRPFWIFFGFSSLYFLLHMAVWQANPNTADKPALLATAYNGRLFGYAILGWAAGLVSRKYVDVRVVFRIAVIVSTLVCILGVLQYYLPKDLLAHFGYSLERGVKPAFFIDDKPSLPRIMSTLRDPNSLGAYLILPIAVLVGGWLKKPKLRMLFTGLLLLHGLALFLTFSRSAWIGAVIASVIVFVWHFKEQTKTILKNYWLYVAAAAAVLLVGAFLLRDQYFVQNVIYHSDENTQLTDSNQLHAQFAENGLKGIVHQPLGHGPGTAGLVSIQTDHVVLTENYFIQIGYELGILGLILLIFLMYYACRMLYQRGDFYSKALLAAFAGITFCGFLLHTWSNEAVACQWWLLAGLVIGTRNTLPSKKRSKPV
jgi:hypothetical protein